jgi:hypothetical protein
MQLQTKLIVTGFGAAALWASPAAAQATRTWVSGVGDDVNPCSRTAPCKTFAGAISKTAAGGEINCIDPGGFGAVTITKSITIDCTGTMGAVLNSGTNGIIINDATGVAEVKLRGLSIDGAGISAGLNGIRFLAGRSLAVENVYIQNQNGGSGISIQPTTAVRVVLENVSIVDGGMGILVMPTSAGQATVLIRNTRIAGNSGVGLKVDSTATSAFDHTVTVEYSDISTNGSGIFTNSTIRNISMTVNATSITSNTGAGISNNGANSTMTVGDTTITGNGSGVSATAGAATFTYGDNRNDGNPNFVAPSNGSFISPPLPKK